MKFKNKYFISLLLVLTLLAVWATPASAATVVSVTPTSIVSDVSRMITITGTGFDEPGSTFAVLMDGSALTSAIIDAQTITATVPALTAAGTHVITVTMNGAPLSPSFNLEVTDAVVVPPTATSAPPPFTRPQLKVSSSGIGDKQIASNKAFKYTVNFNNAGSSTAFNVQAVFTSPDLIPLETGGVAVLGNVTSGGGVGVDQRFISQGSLAGKTFVTIDVTLTYYDDKGTAYSDKFTLTAPVKAESTSGGVAYPTATPTGVNTAQLVITSYASTVDPLQPGDQFQLGMTVQNMGNNTAKRVTMIVGGGSSGSGGGTPQAGGTSGSSGEFTNFAPVGTSNIQSLGDLDAGGAMQVTQNLIVNVSTTPGAYPMKISFSYVNKNGDVVNDDQVITLLVYSLPNLDISFYRPPDPFFAGQPGALPIQVVNLGKRTSVLGSMTIETTGGTLDPSSTLVGSLDPGGYFTFDSTVFPDAAGPLELAITIDYTDDFNQPRIVTKTLELTVEEAFIDPSLDPSMGGGGGEIIVEEESFFHKVWRFILGVLGLDSAAPDSGGGISEPIPEEQVIPIPAGGGGKG